MTVPLSITVYEPGLGGAPTTENPRDISGVVTSYEDSLANEIGCEAMRCTFPVRTLDAAQEWDTRLMSSVVVMTPDARPRWDGFLFEVTITVVTHKRVLKISRSLGDMANSLIVRYANPDGTQGSALVENAVSIARFGKKQIVLNESGATAAEALNRAQTLLAQKAWPLNKQSSELNEPNGRSRAATPGITVELLFHGWGDTLEWLTFSQTADETTTMETTAQVVGLLADFGAVNPFFDLSHARITATGPAALTYVDGDTTYRKRIAQLLGYGTNAQAFMAWGVYVGRAITIGAAARTTPDVITYYESAEDARVRDAQLNAVRPWDYAPNAMCQATDLIEPGIPTGAIATLTRKYIKRVTLRIDRDGAASGVLEPDDVDTLTEMLAKPAGGGTSARSAAIESRITTLPLTRTASSGNPSRYNPSTGAWQPRAGGTGLTDPNAWTGGSLQPSHGGTGMTDPDAWNGSGGGGGGGVLSPDHGGTGVDNGPGGTIDTGGAPITNTGGSPIDLGTGAGIGNAGTPGTSIVTSSGTAGQLALWGLGGTSLTNSAISVISGHDGGQIAFWDLGSGARLETYGKVSLVGYGSGGSINLASGSAFTIDADFEVSPAGATNGQALVYDSSSGAWIPGAAGIGSGTTGRITQWAAGGFTIEDSTLLKTGSGILTIASGTVTGTLTISSVGTLALNGSTLTVSGSININGTGVSPGQVLRANGSGVFLPANTSAFVGSGTAGRVAQWDGSGALLTDSTLIKTGSILTIDATGVYTFTVPASGTAALGTGTTNKIAYWIGPNTLAASSIDITALLGGSGTSGFIPQWTGTQTLGDSTLKKTGSGVLTIDVGTTQTLTIAGSGGGTLTFAGGALNLASFTLTAAKTGTLPIGTGTTNKVAYWTDANTLTAGALDLSAYPSGSGTTGRMAEWGSASTLQASTLVKTGTGILTIASGTVTGTLTISSVGTLALNGSTLTLVGGSNAVLDMRGHTLDLSGDLSTTAGSGGTTIDGGGLIDLNGNTIAITSSITLVGGGFTLTLPASGTVPLGTGITGKLTKWTGTNTLGSSTIDEAALAYHNTVPTGASDGDVITSAGGTAIRPAGGLSWDATSGTLELTGGSIKISGAQVVTNRQTGWSSWTGTAGYGGKNTASATLQDCAEAIKAIIDLLKSHHGLAG